MAPWTDKVLTLTGSLLFSVVVAESALRLLGVEHPVFHQADPVVGTGYRPGVSAWYTEEGHAFVEINSWGYRDKEHSWQKPEGVHRIAVLGDSYVAAQEVAAENTFCSVLERTLNRHPDPRGTVVEVLNFGGYAHGTTQEYLTLRHRVWRFSPDIVLLAVYTGNDIGDNSRKIRRQENLPYFALDGEDLVLDRSFLESDSYRRRSHWLARLLVRTADFSRILQLANFARVGWSYRQRVEELAELTSDQPVVGVGLHSEVYREPQIPLWEEAWHVTEGVLRLMARDVEEKGAKLFLVTLSNPVQVHPDQERRETLERQLGVEDLFYPEHRIRRVAENLGVPFLALAPLFQEHVDRQGIYLHGFGNLGTGHWNEEGHRLAGKLIAHWMVDEEWLRAPESGEGRGLVPAADGRGNQLISVSD